MATPHMQAALSRSFLFFLKDIRLSHSVFALPFAAVGYLQSEAPFPGMRALALLLVCMVSARSFAMGMNRYLDRRIDGNNPRTAGRMIPAGQLSSPAALGWSLSMGVLFLLTSWALNPLAGALSLPLLLILGGYPLMKRISVLTHWYLGFCLGLAPVAVSVALSSRIPGAVLCTGLAVMFWTAGFDILYSLQDLEFDRLEHLHSIPARAGVNASLWISRVCFIAMILCLLGSGVWGNGGLLFYLAVFLVGLILAWEQWLVKGFASDPDNLKINQAFFTGNAWLSVVFYLMVQADALTKAGGLPA